MKNQLLHGLSASDFALLSPHLHAFRCAQGEYLFKADQPVGHAYFMDRGIGSLIAVLAGKQRIEAGLFGRDGFAPTALAMGDNRPGYDGVVQVPDEGHRIATGPFRGALETSPTLRKVMLSYALALSVQTIHTVMAGAMRSVEERLARWILMSDDRWDERELPLTHEVLALILSVRRPSITTGLQALESRGLIKNDRASIIIRDRRGLEAFAGDAYGAPEAEYERLMGEFHQSEPATLRNS